MVNNYWCFLRGYINYINMHFFFFPFCLLEEVKDKIMSKLKLIKLGDRTPDTIGMSKLKEQKWSLIKG